MKKKKTIEYETKVLNIDVNEIMQKLRKLGAEEKEEVLMKRWVYDINPNKRETIRIRDEGDKITVTYKQKTSYQIGDTEEIEIEVSSFDLAASIFHKLGIKNIYYQENKRKIFRLNNLEFCLDSWPNLPTYLEVESDSVKGVQRGLTLLGLVGKDIGNLPVWEIYQMSGVDIHVFPELKF